MNFRRLFSKVSLSLFAFLLIGSTAFAVTSDAPVAPTETLQAVISADETAALGANTEFSATHSLNLFPERPAVFTWNFGDGTTGSGETVTHAFAKSGIFKITLVMRVGKETAETSFEFFVFARSALMLTDSRTYEDKIAALSGAAREQNIFLDTAWGVEDQVGFFAGENALTAALQAKFEALRSTNLVILWTRGSEGLNSLANFAQKLNPPLDFSAKEIVVISDGNLDSLARIARGNFAALAPREILLTRSDALREILLTDDIATLAQKLELQAIPLQAIDSGLEDFKITAPLSFLVNYLVASGIPASVILLVLMLPVIATLVAFLKQVVGVTTLGVYTPSVLTLAFLAIGWKLGIIVLCVVVFASVLIRKILRRYRLAYTPRLAIVLSFVALAIFAAIVLMTWLAPLGSYYRVADLIAASIFPMLIMSTLAEKFVSIQSEKGSRSAVRMLSELLLVSLACYLVVGQWSGFQTLMLAHPEIIFLFIAGDVLLAKFTGLRITEYVRFRELLQKEEEE